MNPAPLHLRQVGPDEAAAYQVYINNKFLRETDDLTIIDMLRLYADVYGVPATMDVVDEGTERPTVISSDHLDEEKTKLFDAIDYPSEILESMGRQLISRSLTVKLIEAAKLLDLPRNALEGAVRTVDDPNAPGSVRVYGVQQMFPTARYAQFLAIMHWVPQSIAFEIMFSPIEIKSGEFGKEEIIIGGDS
jgi:hypothetical protein